MEELNKIEGYEAHYAYMGVPRTEETVLFERIIITASLFLASCLMVAGVWLFLDIFKYWAGFIGGGVYLGFCWYLATKVVD